MKMGRKKKENDRWLMRTREQALTNGLAIPDIKPEPVLGTRVKAEEGADEEIDFNDTFADDEGDFGDIFKEEGDREEHVNIILLFGVMPTIAELISPSS